MQPTNEPMLTPVSDQADLTGIQVLVVDDDADSRDLIATILDQFGAGVRVTASAEEALAALKQFIPDVLVCDIGMPDIDGYTLLREIRGLPPEQGGLIPAIALTAYVGDSNRQQALQAGFQQHIAKPVELDEVVAKVLIVSQESKANQP
jgi:CheY-like chemotaxis protein